MRSFASRREILLFIKSAKKSDHHKNGDRHKSFMTTDKTDPYQTETHAFCDRCRLAEWRLSKMKIIPRLFELVYLCAALLLLLAPPIPSVASENCRLKSVN